MKFKWRILPDPTDVSTALLQVVDGSRMLARLLVQRGIEDPKDALRFLEPQAFSPASPNTLTDLEKGADRIEVAISNREKILVWGDFDVDGQTSTALLVSALRGLGAEVDYHIPIRESEGHGIRPEFLKPYLEDGIDVLLSCDTGIAAHEAVDLANSYSVDVVITDHHDLPSELPAAHALINPKREPEDHSMSGLPGVGVAYELMDELYTRAGRAGELDRFLDLVALGIVADVAIQTKDTRYLLQRGLEILRQTRRPGLLALLDLANVDPFVVNDETIGFQLGPRLNAVGRLADANVSVELLTTDDISRAREIAADLEEFNLRRRFETDTVYGSAKEQINRNPSLLQYAALVLSHPKWHQGVIGIVASRLVEEFGKPTILISAPEGKAARGSARSIEGYHITQAIATQAAFLHGFGGHPMAAGLSLDAGDIERFRRGVSKAIVEQRVGEPPEPTLDISAEVPLGELALDLANEIEMLAPFGAGNPPVNLLCRGLAIEEVKLIGKEKKHRKLFVSDDKGARTEILWWNSVDQYLPEGPLDVVVRIRPGSYRGERTTTVTLQDLDPARDAGGASGKTSYRIHDFRMAEHPEAELRNILAQIASVQVWSEVSAALGEVRNRMDLKPARELVLWTSPPGPRVLTTLLKKVQPETIYLFAQNPGLDEPAPFIKRLVGLVKYALMHYDGETTLDELAAACAHDENTVRAGLELLPSLGVVAKIDEDRRVFLTRRNSEEDNGGGADLEALLKEVKAFRRAFAQAVSVNSFWHLKF